MELNKLIEKKLLNMQENSEIIEKQSMQGEFSYQILKYIFKS